MKAGRIVGAAKIARDITQRKKTERALRTTERLASVGRLAATVAHEMNNPLEAVTNLVYLAQGTESIDANKGISRFCRIRTRPCVSHNKADPRVLPRDQSFITSQTGFAHSASHLDSSTRGFGTNQSRLTARFARIRKSSACREKSVSYSQTCWETALTRCLAPGEFGSAYLLPGNMAEN